MSAFSHGRLVSPCNVQPVAENEYFYTVPVKFDFDLSTRELDLDIVRMNQLARYLSKRVISYESYCTDTQTEWQKHTHETECCSWTTKVIGCCTRTMPETTERSAECAFSLQFARKLKSTRCIIGRKLTRSVAEACAWRVSSGMFAAEFFVMDDNARTGAAAVHIQQHETYFVTS